MVNAGEIVAILLGIGLCIALFLVLRRVVLWYWGVSAVLTHLDVLVQQNNELLALLRKQTPEPAIPKIASELE